MNSASAIFLKNTQASDQAAAQVNQLIFSSFIDIVRFVDEGWLPETDQANVGASNQATEVKSIIDSQDLILIL